MQLYEEQKELYEAEKALADNLKSKYAVMRSRVEKSASSLDPK
jgi:predicted translin family RNA/ssDNA-binding protein